MFALLYELLNDFYAVFSGSTEVPLTLDKRTWFQLLRRGQFPNLDVFVGDDCLHTAVNLERYDPSS